MSVTEKEGNAVSTGDERDRRVALRAESNSDSAPKLPAADSFPPGTILGDRFRIVRRVGAGGMGMVYEAVDQNLDRRVAIKCAKPGHRLHLPPEARTAREVSHFNVCKVHDLHTASTPFGEVNFLSMEFVAGETLWARINRAGPLKAGEAFGIAGQICAGLAQAHRQGIIHGDLKPANVILAGTVNGGLRAVITDFGLAKFAAPDGSRIRSSSGGTIDYMAPELLLGDSISIASDVYALGVLFHEMLTGHTPKRAKAGGAQARLDPASAPTVTPDSPTVTIGPRIVEADWKRRIGDLPRRWDRVIRKCLEPHPARRFPSAESVMGALAPRRTLLRWGTTVLTISAAAFGYFQWREPPTGAPIRLAVLPFEADGNLRADASGVALDIADRLSGAQKNFTVVTPAEARQNQVDSPEKARSILGANYALATHLAAAGNQISADAQLIDLASGNTVSTLHSAYAPGDTVILAQALLGTVTAGLKLKSRAPRESVLSAAYPAYIEGLNALQQDVRRAGDAIPFLEQAIAADPRSALPYSALAKAEMQRFINGDGRQWLDKAAAAAGKATAINPDSVPALLASAGVDESRGRYEQSVAALNRAVTLDPGNPEVWRALATCYQAAGRDEDAAITYRKAIEAQPAGYLPYLNFGTYYLVRGQYQRAEEMYRKVTALAPGLSSGYMNLGLALKQQGRYTEAEQSLLKALSLRVSARLLLNIGALYYEQERYPEALRMFQEGAKLGPPSAPLLRNLGDAYRHLSRSREAAEEYRAARVQAEDDVTTNPRSPEARARLALLSARLGDTHRASYELSQALAMGAGNAMVAAAAVQVFEILKQRDKALEVLQTAPRSLLQELARVPDLIQLRQDPRFQQLLEKP